MAQITNEWITLSELRKGVTVQRKFAGLDTQIATDNTVEYCRVRYWERELYPNGDVIRTKLKVYSLEDLPYEELEVDGVLKYREPLAVLSGFIASVGNDFIINPARDTLENTIILPFDSYNGYPLRKNTRPLFDVPPTEPE